MRARLFSFSPQDMARVPNVANCPDLTMGDALGLGPPRRLYQPASPDHQLIGIAGMSWTAVAWRLERCSRSCWGGTCSLNGALYALHMGRTHRCHAGASGSPTCGSSPRALTLACQQLCSAFHETLDDLKLELCLVFFIEPLEVRPTSGGRSPGPIQHRESIQGGAQRLGAHESRSIRSYGTTTVRGGVVV
ncbi:hypothetical protein D3C87_1366040 [compost metagenome]